MIHVMKETQLLGVLGGKTGDQIIEVALQRAADGSEKIKVCHREWAAGIGWYTQKTLEIGKDQIDQFIQILGKSKRQYPGLRRREPGNILPFRNCGT